MGQDKMLKDLFQKPMTQEMVLKISVITKAEKKAQDDKDVEMEGEQAKDGKDEPADKKQKKMA